MFSKEKLLSLFVHVMIVYPKNSRESTEKLIREYDRGQSDGQYQNNTLAVILIRKDKIKKRSPLCGFFSDSPCPEQMER